MRYTAATLLGYTAEFAAKSLEDGLYSYENRGGDMGKDCSGFGGSLHDYEGLTGYQLQELATFLTRFKDIYMDNILRILERIQDDNLTEQDKGTAEDLLSMLTEVI
jgi:hypothetical protein